MKSHHLLIVAAAFIGTTAQAFPENVRYGYASCSTCHVSPTGGGALTAYGRGASEEFMGTWSRKGENEFAAGAVTLPEWAIAGGDLRTLSFARENGVFKENRGFPMQVDVEVGAHMSAITVDGTFGYYDSSVQSQRHYVMANIGDHVFTRIGRFFPAFGIYTPDHATPTRRGLGFNQGRETYNAEVGVMGELGEIIADAVLKSGQLELSDEEKGYSVRAAWYAGGKSQLGVSLFGGRGTVWNRQIAGLFAITGLTKSTFLLTEVDQETKKPVEESDVSTLESTRLVTYNKAGWELHRGVTAFATYEASLTTKGSFDPRMWAAGPGLQWLPRPHFEVVAQAQVKHDETWSKNRGYLATLMFHYYL